MGRRVIGIVAVLLCFVPTTLAGQAATAERGVAEPTAIVYRDSFGVPHIFGPTDASVLFAAAWVQAEEDWPMVEENFVRASGRATELMGEEALIDDYLARALEIPRLAREEYTRASPRMRSLLEGYAEGFNVYLRDHPDQRRLLDRVEPWHTLALMRFKYHQLEFLAYSGFEREWAERFLKEGWPGGGQDAAAVSPVTSGADWGSDAITRFAGDIRGPLGDIPLGSNEWAVAPSRTADGHAMLLVNPHQSFFGVERYLEIHLHSDEGLVFSGLTRFGFMLPYMGNNDRLGWTYTDNYADISDLYVEMIGGSDDPLRYRYGDEWRAVETWTETVEVGANESKTLRFWKTHHGPIVGLDDEGRPLAARIAKLHEGGWLDQLDAMIRSRALAEFRAAIAQLGVPYMNTMYADADGNILYVYNSAVPRRDPMFDWRQPVDGSDPRTEWGDYHPLEDLPQILNPPSGWLLNTNSSPMVATDSVPYTRDDFPPYMIGEEEDNWRARSSRRVLEGLDEITFDDFARAVWDTRLSFADSVIPVIAEEWERLESAEATDVPAVLAPESPARAMVGDAVARLLAWDRVADVGSVETTWFVIALERWYADSQTGIPPGPFAHLENLAETLTGLGEAHGRIEVPWGDVNRLQRPPSQDPDDFSEDLPSLPVAGAPSAVGSVFVFHVDPFASTGVRHGVHGNSFVKVIEFGPRTRGRSVLVFGQSGDPDSPHFFDQAPLYSERRFKPAWFTREEVEANAARSYQPGVASGP